MVEGGAGSLVWARDMNGLTALNYLEGMRARGRAGLGSEPRALNHAALAGPDNRIAPHDRRVADALRQMALAVAPPGDHYDVSGMSRCLAAR